MYLYERGYVFSDFTGLWGEDFGRFAGSDYLYRLKHFWNFYEVYCHNNIGADDREPYIQRHSFMEAPR